MNFKSFDIDEYKRSKEHKTIIIYGDGWMAHITAEVLRSNGIKDLIYANYSGDKYISFENTISFDDLIEKFSTGLYMILWAVAGYSRFESTEFENCGIKTVYSVRALWKDLNSKDYPIIDIYHYEYEKRDDFFFFEDVIQNDGGIYLYSLDAVVTERCTLRCKDCSNLMQYYCKPRNLDIDELIETIRKILNRIDRLHDLRILGGEPFINLDFVRLIDQFVSEKKIDRITILSNGSIFPNRDVLEKLRHAKVILRFSDYGELSRKLERWVCWCKEEHIRYQVAKTDVWQDMGNLERHNYSEHRLRDIYGNCECRNTPTVFGNRLFNCAYAANASNLGAIAKDEKQIDYIEIDEGVSGQQIDSFLYDRKYLEACRYCGGRNANRASVVPNIQTKVPLKYTRLENMDVNICGENDSQEKVFNNIENKKAIMVSVIIPVYNAGKTIETCVNSVLNQTYENIEILLVDDGSTDDSSIKCEAISKKMIANRIIRYVQISHSGVVVARNKAIGLATGEYITFVDADDWIEPDHIQTLVDGMDGCDLCFDGWYSENRRKRISDSQFDRGQGQLEFLHTFPEEGIYYYTEIQRMLVEHIIVKWDGLFDPIWNKMFKTEKLRNVAKRVTDSIIIGEDIAYNLGYLFECEKISVKNHIGYHYIMADRRKAKNKYEYKKMYMSLGYLRDVLDEMSDNKPIVIKNITDTVYHHLFELLLDEEGVSRKKNRIFYYPYFGRLRGKKIILYGAGDVGKSYYQSIIKEPEVELVAWVDKDAIQICNNQFLPVKEINSITELEYDYIIVGVNHKPLYEQIQMELVGMGCKEENILWNMTKIIALY